MSLVRLVQEDLFSSVDQPALARGKGAYGKVLNTWAAIGNSEGLFSAYLPFVVRVNADSSVGRIKELLGVRVAVLNHCRYTASHRCASAISKGISTEDLAAVARGDWSDFDEREQIALQLAESMTLDIPVVSSSESGTGVPLLLWEEAQLHFGAGELVEVCMSISLWNALSRFHRVMNFELDMPPAPPEVLSEL